MDFTDYSGYELILSIGFLVLGFFFHAYITKTNAIAASKQSKAILTEAQKEADVIRREAKVQAKDAILRARENSERDLTAQRKDILDLEKRVVEREKTLSSKLDMLNTKEVQLTGRMTEISEHKEKLIGQQQELKKLIAEETSRIEDAAALSKEEARKTIMKRMEDELQAEANGLVRHVQKVAKEDAKKIAREIIATAIQRYAAETVCDLTTSSVSLESDDIKGRIIGKEGRNIKSFESETGVNVLIDETPEVVVLSSYDPIRREVARVALERLVEDGRIHPARIEETVAKVRQEIDETIRHAGETALFGLGLTGVAPELVHTLGKLKFRTSYKQNVLDHSIETAHIMALMATEMGLDAKIAKRIGIFHDIGKAIDHEAEGGHAVLGANLLRKYGEDRIVYNAVGSHHEDMERESVYAVLCDAADALTAARPGARMEATDLYIQRLEKIEEIANQYAGVKSSYAVQAGREIRIMVEPKKFNDHGTSLLAKNIAKQIGNEVKIPGTVRVTVIRETRCVEYAK
ncbi:Ribonuclease Y [Pontiella desulfatans]|uniref:Ribonuclease Y n=1 Tax=Pontiella desulfatans TaxID=2750659 RepID=A0A6C2TYL6_PONDE|nr:ribonuclease Y [Pontiella desulfatans]VGO12742.1 Ribonuclease Y [Pontiella desulfatans]